MKKVVILQPENGGTVAQLVEQRTENPRVTGSIPVGTTSIKGRKICVPIFLLQEPSIQVQQLTQKKRLPQRKRFLL